MGMKAIINAENPTLTIEASFEQTDVESVKITAGLNEEENEIKATISSKSKDRANHITNLEFLIALTEDGDNLNVELNWPPGMDIMTLMR